MYSHTFVYYILCLYYVFWPKGHNTYQTNIWKAMYLSPYINYFCLHSNPLTFSINNLTLYWHLITLCDGYSGSINIYCACVCDPLATIGTDRSHAGYVWSILSTKQSEKVLFPRPNLLFWYYMAIQFICVLVFLIFKKMVQWEWPCGHVW